MRTRVPALLLTATSQLRYPSAGGTPEEITAEWGLRTVPTGLAYPLCNSVECQACGALFLDIRFDEAEMERLYGGYRGPQYAKQR